MFSLNDLLKYGVVKSGTDERKAHAEQDHNGKVFGGVSEVPTWLIQQTLLFKKCGVFFFFNFEVNYRVTNMFRLLF